MKNNSNKIKIIVKYLIIKMIMRLTYKGVYPNLIIVFSCNNKTVIQKIKTILFNLHNKINYNNKIYMQKYKIKINLDKIINNNKINNKTNIMMNKLKFYYNQIELKKL